MKFSFFSKLPLVVGALAKLIVPGRDPGGIIITMLLGIAGSFIAGLIGRALGWYAQGQSAGFFATILGAILLLVIYHAIVGRTGGGGRFRRAA